MISQFRTLMKAFEKWKQMKTKRGLKGLSINCWPIKSFLKYYMVETYVVHRS